MPPCSACGGSWDIVEIRKESHETSPWEESRGGGRIGDAGNYVLRADRPAPVELADADAVPAASDWVLASARADGAELDFVRRVQGRSTALLARSPEICAEGVDAGAAGEDPRAVRWAMWMSGGEGLMRYFASLVISFRKAS